MGKSVQESFSLDCCRRVMGPFKPKTQPNKLQRKHEIIANGAHALAKLAFLGGHAFVAYKHFCAYSQHSEALAPTQTAFLDQPKTAVLGMLLEVPALVLCLVRQPLLAGCLSLADVGGGGLLLHLFFFPQSFTSRLSTCSWIFGLNVVTISMILSDVRSMRPFKQLFAMSFSAYPVGMILFGLLYIVRGTISKSSEL